MSSNFIVSDPLIALRFFTNRHFLFRGSSFLFDFGENSESGLSLAYTDLSFGGSSVSREYNDLISRLGHSMGDPSFLSIRLRPDIFCGDLSCSNVAQIFPEWIKQQWRRLESRHFSFGFSDSNEEDCPGFFWYCEKYDMKSDGTFPSKIEAIIDARDTILLHHDLVDLIRDQKNMGEYEVYSMSMDQDMVVLKRGDEFIEAKGSEIICTALS